MIKKDRRLVEREIRKVLKYKKPFFSYSVIANVATNRLGISRFAAIFSGKSVECGASRNFFRRRAYDLARPFLSASAGLDVVIVPKKGKKPLDHRDSEAVRAFEEDVRHLYRKIFLETAAPTAPTPGRAPSAPGSQDPAGIPKP